MNSRKLEDSHKGAQLELIALVIQGFVAIGTLSVAASAIWGDWIRHKVAGPKLRIALSDSEGTLTRQNDGQQGRYYKVRVWNERKWSPARNTRVVLKSLYKRTTDGSFVPEPLSGPLQLTWQWLVPQFPTVGAGEEVCTFARLIQGEPRLVLSTYTIPNNFTGFIGAKESMIIEIAAVSDTADSEPLLLELFWNGSWSDNPSEMAKNVVIKNWVTSCLSNGVAVG